MKLLPLPSSRLPMLLLTCCLAAAVALPLGCASPGNPIPTDPPPQAETWQLHAAAVYGLSTMEENGIDLHGTGVLKGSDWHNYIDGVKTARGLLHPAGAALTDVDIAKAIAIAKAAVKTGHAVWIMLNAAAIGEETAAEYESAGPKADEAFDKYVLLHPD